MVTEELGKIKEKRNWKKCVKHDVTGQSAEQSASQSVVSKPRQRMQGTVVCWFHEKDWGLVRGDEGKKEVYCHRRGVWLDDGHRNPKVGSRVCFDLEMNA